MLSRYRWGESSVDDAIVEKMTEALQDLLRPQLTAGGHGIAKPDAISTYLERLSTLSLPSLITTEPDALSHDAQSVQRSIQALSKRSHKSVGIAEQSLSKLEIDVPQLARNAAQLQKLVPVVEHEALKFAEKYEKTLENPVLARRRRAMHLGDNIERVSDILELSNLLSSTIASSSSNIAGNPTGQLSSANASYASALDLHGHIKRLHRLYPDSNLISSISEQADGALSIMTTNLIASLKSPSLKLTAAMRIIGLLRRVAPDLEDSSGSFDSWTSGSGEGSFGALFLVCRLANLNSTLHALDPLKDLADTEQSSGTSGEPSRDEVQNSSGQQTERYLKRYIETFREHSFGIVSMYKSIFPSALQETAVMSSSLPLPKTSLHKGLPAQQPDPLQVVPSALSTFMPHVVDMLVSTLQEYLPNIPGQSAKDSLITQVLYCANSLGRLGADISMLLPLLYEDTTDATATNTGQIAAYEDAEWVRIMKKHKVQASRLEVLANGVGTRSITKEMTSNA